MMINNMSNNTIGKARGLKEKNEKDHIKFGACKRGSLV